MNKYVRIGIVALLVLCIAGGGYWFLRPTTGADIPSVFIHGYSGWGTYDDRYEEIPYWGLTNEDFRVMFDRWDQDIYIPSVGPVSSAWDRACEIYAQITGTRVDYGAAHSAKCGHERFGRDYSGEPLIKDFVWDEEHPVNLVGHSFGGNTARVLLDLLADGAPEEVAATGDETSPLFEGGHTGMVFSLAMIASPSNGTTLVNATLESGNGSSNGRSFGMASTYDARLDQFGITADAAPTQDSAAEMMDKIDFYGHNDSAVNDMTVDRACAMNAELELQPDVYYYIYYGCRTEADGTGASVPTENMCRYLRDQASVIGSYTGRTAGGYSVGYGDAKETFTVPAQDLNAEWQPNDGTVNVLSAYCPYHLDANGERVYDAHTEYSGTGPAEPGVWNILPEFDEDHYGFIGGIHSEDIRVVRQIYQDMHDRLKALKVK
ncbi:MAG: hypothetical protein IJI11_01955 [Mogibacterium sp.]|nr:hypothetical protein [Mogibacterium sp.]